MKTHVAIYKSQKDATNAIENLIEKNFPIEKLSMIEKADVVEKLIKVKSIANIKIIPILIITILGLILGVLASKELFTFPGLQFLNGIEPLIGGFIGFDFGLIIGSILVIIIALIFKKDKSIEMKKYVENTNFLVVVEGSLDDIKKAERILHTEGSHNYRLVCTYCNAKNLAPAKA